MKRFSLSLVVFSLAISSLWAQHLPGTKPLKMKGDLAAHMVAGIDRYLMKEIAASVKKRQQFWKQDFASAKAYDQSVAGNRRRLRRLIGVVDERVPAELQYIGINENSALVAETTQVKIYSVRWPVLTGMHAEGLLLQPKGKIRACVVAVPDADQTPESFAGVVKEKENFDPRPALALRLAKGGCQVLVPTLIDRKDTWSGNPGIGRMTNQPHREFVYRMSYEMGRHIIGYEVQKVLAAVDWFCRKKEHPPIGVVGYGEGGLIAFYAGACDRRIDVTGVSGYFGPREEMWREPIYRNVWSLLREFGDAEIAGLICPRTLLIEDHHGPLIEGPPAPRNGRGGAAPGSTLYRKDNAAARRAEFQRAIKFSFARLKNQDALKFIAAGESPLYTDTWVNLLLGRLTGKKADSTLPTEAPVDRRPKFDPDQRMKRQFDEAVAYTQNLLPTAVHRRDQFWNKMDTSSVEKWEQSTKYYKDYFHDEIIGRLPAATKAMNPRTRLIYQTPKWKGYEVVLDLYDDVICYGIILIPNDIKPGEKRPVVVCQHGLEGRPTDVCNPKKKTRYYNSFGAQLADLGFIVFAPQNPYIGHDKFRVLIRKGHPVKLSLYSFIVQQHERILDWLETLPFVDARRIAFYGLSYGGKTAMRIGALVGRYAVVICSGDFNEWIWKNINLVWRGSYMFTMEYDMYEFDLGNTFNYAEMARLIAPRPFMVERGHDDGVGLDEWVAHEYARVRRDYSRLKIPERTEIEFFAGHHEIHGQGTFRFLARFLKGKK